MTVAQGNVLSVLAGSRKPVPAVWVARILRVREAHVTRTLDACFRRSWVTINDRGWVLTDRGRRKVAGMDEA